MNIHVAASIYIKMATLASQITHLNGVELSTYERVKMYIRTKHPKIVFQEGNGSQALIILI